MNMGPWASYGPLVPMVHSAYIRIPDYGSMQSRIGWTVDTWVLRGLLRGLYGV